MASPLPWRATSTEYGLIVVVALGWLGFVAGRLGLYEHGLDALVLQAFDTKIYLLTADWIMGRISLSEAGYGPSVYPLLFPFILGLAWSLHTLAIVLLQTLLWLASILLMVRLCAQVSGRRWVGLALGLVFISLVTPAALVFYGLSDTTGAFFAIVSLTFLEQHARDKRGVTMFAAVLALSLAVLIKSVFMYPAVALTLAGLWSNRRQPRQLLLVAAGLLPVIIQSVWFYSAYGLAKPSAADIYTLNEYFLARVDAPHDRGKLIAERERRHLAYLEALDTHSLPTFSKMVRAELSQAWNQRRDSVVSSFLLNLGENSRAGSNFVPMAPTLRRWSTTQNRTATRALLGIIPLVLLLELLWLRRARRSLGWHEDPQVYFRGYVLVAPVYFLVTTGLAYFQGDRYALLYFPPIFVLIARIYRDIESQVASLRHRRATAE